MKQFTRTTLSLAVAQAVMLLAAPVFAQQATDSKTDAKTDSKTETKAEGKTEGKADAKADSKTDGKKDNKIDIIVVTGRRKAIESAQKIKRDADEIVDSIVAEDIGKLPDNSVAEVLQRVVGVTIDRTVARNDPVRYSVEGSGVVIRGLTYVSSQLNGRETFSANQGRNLGFEDVPPELMLGVDVYKNPSAEQIEGGIAGLVNLRTALPLDFNGFKAAASLSASYSELRKNTKPEGSFLVSNIWNTDLGKFGALLDVAHSESSNRSDAMGVSPYYPTVTPTGSQVNGSDGYTVNPENRWSPRSLYWRQQGYDRTRDGIYGALQWKKDNFESSLTYFHSKYKFTHDELELRVLGDPYKRRFSADSVWGADGVLRSGTVFDTSSTEGFETEVKAKISNRVSTTQDLSWNFRWKPANQWTLTSDLQYVRSKTESFDSTVGTGIILPKLNMDLTGTRPRLNFDAADTAFLADPANYYWSMTMEHLDRGTGSQKVAKADARFQFEDNPYLNDLRFGLRFAERSAVNENSNPDWNWAAVTQAWMRGWYTTDLARIQNYSDPTTFQTFNNFMGGASPMPGMYFPAASVVTGFPGSYQSLHDHVKQLCSGWPDGDRCGWMSGGSNPNQWTPGSLSGGAGSINDQKERTLAAYTQLRFDYDQGPVPIDGNVGLRVVHTKGRATGQTTFSVAGVPATVTSLTAFSVPESFDNNYTNVLPSLNMRFKPRDDLQFRFAWAKAISRPAFTDLIATSSLRMSADIDQATGAVRSVSLTGSNNGNPNLKPVQSNQQDVTAEWYFSKTGSLTVAAFNKDFKDVILDQLYSRTLTDGEGRAFNFTITGKANAATGRARGIELGYKQYFDMLPDWMSGFGIDANYTYVDSKLKRYDDVKLEYCTAGNSAANLNLFINGCDTTGRSFSGQLPMPNLSRNTVNFALLYDRGPVSARLAYSWRQRYLQNVAISGDDTGFNSQSGLDTNPSSPTYGASNLPLGLPIWGDSYGQLDAGFQYRFNDNLTVSFEGANLTNTAWKQLMQQHIGLQMHNYFVSGRRYKLGMRYTF